MNDDEDIYKKRPILTKSSTIDQLIEDNEQTLGQILKYDSISDQNKVMIRQNEIIVKLLQDINNNIKKLNKL